MSCKRLRSRVAETACAPHSQVRAQAATYGLAVVAAVLCGWENVDPVPESALLNVYTTGIKRCQSPHPQPGSRRHDPTCTNAIFCGHFCGVYESFLRLLRSCVQSPMLRPAFAYHRCRPQARDQPKGNFDEISPPAFDHPYSSAAPARVAHSRHRRGDRPGRTGPGGPSVVRRFAADPTGGRRDVEHRLSVAEYAASECGGCDDTVQYTLKDSPVHPRPSSRRAARARGEPRRPRWSHGRASDVLLIAPSQTSQPSPP